VVRQRLLAVSQSSMMDVDAAEALGNGTGDARAAWSGA
jgi:hypothetical protein